MTINKKNTSKEMPFSSHKKRKKQKEFTVKVACMCLSLLTLILLEKDIVLEGKKFISFPERQKKQSVFQTMENLKPNMGLKQEIKRKIARTHKILHKKNMPDSHFHVEATIEEDF